MSDQEKTRFLRFWKPRHRLGKTKYIVRQTLIMAVLLLGISVLFDLFGQSFAEAVSQNLAMKNLIADLIFGGIVALLDWNGNERLYRKLQGESDFLRA